MTDLIMILIIVFSLLLAVLLAVLFSVPVFRKGKHRLRC